jgi:hypothetical protein
VGQPDAVTVDAWSEDAGLRRWTLGVAIEGLGVVGGDQAVAHFMLTDAADVSLEVADADGRVLSRRSAGRLAAGAHDLALTAADLNGLDGSRDAMLRLSAASAYGGSAAVIARAAFRATGGSVALPARPMVLGNWPNPVRGSTTISFALPANTGRASLAVFDAAGRRVRRFGGSFAPGLNSVVWDGTDDAGRTSGAGLYFYRLEVDGLDFSGRMVVAR